MLDSLAFNVAAPHTEWVHAIYIVLMAFLLSTMVGVTYVKTFQGLSFSRNYVQAVILASIVSATVMLAIGDSLARGLGMIGALAIVRFRTNFKDAKDILFMFVSLAAGIGCGVGAYKAATVGTMGFVITSVILHFSPIGQVRMFDGMLRFNCASDADQQSLLEKILRTHCKTFVLVTLREMQQGQRLDYAYQVKLKKGQDGQLICALFTELASARGISLMLQEATVEL
ncbi:hypothetical protein Dvar_27580 [Desulfosarcina variabilis str. Montpellier]|uniref:DUF4956 domain-containing protein n=1 Tax=Desulfosarcina variabilis TaxID=2300 RepID=UPI003AFB0805